MYGESTCSNCRVIYYLMNIEYPFFSHNTEINSAVDVKYSKGLSYFTLNRSCKFSSRSSDSGICIRKQWCFSKCLTAIKGEPGEVNIKGILLFFHVSGHAGSLLYDEGTL